MKAIPLATASRASDVRVNALRKENGVPCVLYGNDVENTLLQCDHNEVIKVYKKAGGSSLVELDVNGKKVPVLFHAVDLDPVSDRITHIDFYAVNMKKEIEAQVPISFVGESLAVKELGAIFVAGHDHVWVKCLPANLPHDLPVSIESLKEFGDVLTVADIALPEGVVIEEEAEMVVASVQEPREEVEEEPKPAEGEAAAGAEGEGGKEGAESAEAKDDAGE